MRRSKFYELVALLALFLVIATAAGPMTQRSAAHSVAGTARPETPQSNPSESLSRGRAFLKQGHADQALPLLQSALTGFTQTNNPRGIAAAEDALGDLYMVQGQYKVALDHY